MKRQALSFLSFVLFAAAPLSAMRLPPPVLLPLDDGAYRFVAWNDMPKIKRNLYAGGHVVAYLKTTGEKRWERYLYKVSVDPKVERDIQDVYLKKMYLGRANQLILQNERGEWFVLEKRTGSLLNGAAFEQRPDDPSVYYGKDDRVEPLLKGDYLVEVGASVTYGHQTLKATDVPTGKVLWEKRIPVPRVGSLERSRILFLDLSGKSLAVNFEDGSSCLMDVDTGRLLRTGALK